MKDREILEKKIANRKYFEQELDIINDVNNAVKVLVGKVREVRKKARYRELELYLDNIRDKLAMIILEGLELRGENIEEIDKIDAFLKEKGVIRDQEV